MGMFGMGAGGGPWDPKAISGTALWLNSELGITKDGSNHITAWKDQTRDLVLTAGGTPHWVDGQIGTQPIVRLDGIGDYFQNSGTSPLAANANRSMIFVLKGGATLATSWSFLMGLTQRKDAGDMGIVMASFSVFSEAGVGGSANNTWLTQAGSGVLAVANGHPITNYTAAYVCLREDLNFSTGAQAVYRNGAAVTLSSTTFSLTEANVAGEEGAFLGCQIVGAGPRRYWEGDIADIIVTNGIISTADWAAYKIWAAGKYGLTFS